MTAEAHRGDRKLQPTGTEAQPPDSNDGGATGSGATAAPRALPSPCDVTGMTGEGASPRPAPLPSAIPGTIITRAGPSPVAVDAGRSQEGVVSPSTATESCARPPPQPPLQLASSSVAAVAAAGSPSGATSSIGGGGFPRLRSLTPQPYAGAGKGSQRRRHRFVNVTLPSAPPSPQTELFQTFQRTVRDVYDVYEKLSEGTYGEVFRGVDKRTGAVVALKRLKMLSMHQGFPQTSLREVIALRHIQLQRERLEARQRQATGPSSAARASTVSNPLAEVAQLCDVLVFDRTRPDIVLVFAYATASLAGLLRRQFIFSPPELAYVMKKLLTAVRKLHDMSIIHRDIKSDNVLITSNGEVQLTDFGLCSIISSNGGGGGTSVTPGRAWRTPSVITLAYRPPEMLLGSTAYDEKVDVWSVGCLLAQLYLFEPPFYRHRVLQQQQQQQQGQPQRTAATELEQLSRITEVLGPLPPARVYHPEACQHMRVLGELEEQGRLAEAGKAAQPANWGKLQSLFEPSFLFQQFHGFRGWFEAEVQRTRHQPQRRPTQACMDVLCAALQLDPQQRPSAAELLRMPYFTTLDDAPLQGTYHRPIAVTPEREEEVRRGFMLKVQRCGDSHTQRRPH
jgi:serine/threonine protein kinase